MQQTNFSRICDCKMHFKYLLLVFVLMSSSAVSNCLMFTLSSTRDDKCFICQACPCLLPPDIRPFCPCACALLPILSMHRDDKCFVCQAFADDLEERTVLTKFITSGADVGDLVRRTCDRLVSEIYCHKGTTSTLYLLLLLLD